MEFRHHREIHTILKEYNPMTKICKKGGWMMHTCGRRRLASPKLIKLRKDFRPSLLRREALSYGYSNRLTSRPSSQSGLQGDTGGAFSNDPNKGDGCGGLVLPPVSLSSKAASDTLKSKLHKLVIESEKRKRHCYNGGSCKGHTTSSSPREKQLTLTPTTSPRHDQVVLRDFPPIAASPEMSDLGSRQVKVVEFHAEPEKATHLRDPQTGSTAPSIRSLSRESDGAGEMLEKGPDDDTTSLANPSAVFFLTEEGGEPIGPPANDEAMALKRLETFVSAALAKEAASVKLTDVKSADTIVELQPAQAITASDIMTQGTAALHEAAECLSDSRTFDSPTECALLKYQEQASPLRTFRPIHPLTISLQTLQREDQISVKSRYAEPSAVKPTRKHAKLQQHRQLHHQHHHQHQQQEQEHHEQEQEPEQQQEEEEQQHPQAAYSSASKLVSPRSAGVLKAGLPSAALVTRRSILRARHLGIDVNPASSPDAGPTDGAASMPAKLKDGGTASDALARGVGVGLRVAGAVNALQASMQTAGTETANLQKAEHPRLRSIGLIMMNQNSVEATGSVADRLRARAVKIIARKSASNTPTAACSPGNLIATLATATALEAVHDERGAVPATGGNLGTSGSACRAPPVVRSKRPVLIEQLQKSAQEAVIANITEHGKDGTAHFSEFRKFKESSLVSYYSRSEAEVARYHSQSKQLFQQKYNTLTVCLHHF
ncbi:hypothetical protein DIPPA_00449 [Diplonema papillatum]|nr:hypothetical protein DIPPA_00449 [Diplonema papillatum]